MKFSSNNQRDTAAKGDEDEGETGEYPVLVRRSLKPRIKICPKCFSPVKQVSSFGGWLIPEVYDCESCGYRGPVAFERSDDEEIIENLKESEHDESQTVDN